MLNGIEHEAAIHEAAHIWYYLYQNDALAAMLIDMMMVESERTHMARWKAFRQLMATYRWGDGQGWSGMWVESAHRFNHDEIWAGGASFSMGDMMKYPPMVRRIYERMFLPREVAAYLPLVMG